MLITLVFSWGNIQIYVWALAYNKILFNMSKFLEVTIDKFNDYTIIGNKEV